MLAFFEIFPSYMMSFIINILASHICNLHINPMFFGVWILSEF